MVQLWLAALSALSLGANFVLSDPTTRGEPAAVTSQTGVSQTDPKSCSDSVGRADALWEQAETSHAGADYEATLSYLKGAAGDEPAMLWRLARAYKDVATRVAGADRKTLNLEGLEVARRATLHGPELFKSHLWMGIMLGQVSDHVGVMDKLKGAYGIRDNFRRATELEPNHAESVHFLGQWSFGIADMGAGSWIARNGMATIGLKSSFEEALGHFRAAEALKPAYLVNDFMIGRSHNALGHWAEAAAYLTKVVDAGKQTNPDDEEARQAAAKMLAEVKRKY